MCKEERFIASDLRSGGRVVRIWVRILAATLVLNEYNSVRVEIDIVFEKASEALQ